MRLSTIISWTITGGLLGGFACIAFSMLSPFRAFFYTNIIMGACFVTAGYALAALPCALALERGRMQPLMSLGLISCALGAVISTIIIWMLNNWIGPPAPVLARLMGTNIVVCVWCAVLAGCIMNRMSSSLGHVFRTLTLIAATLLGVMVLFAIWSSHRDGPDEGVFKTMAILGVITVFGLVTTMIFARLKQFTSSDGQAEELVRMDLNVSCPRCKLRQAIQTGGANCAQCGLGIRVMVP